MALPPVNGKPKGPIRIPATPKQAPTGPTAPTTTLPDPIERNKTISVRPAGATGSADVLERNIEFKLEEERLASAEGRAKELGIPVPAGTGLEKYKDSPYFKETTSIGQIIFTNPKTGKDVYYNPETGLIPGFENYGVSRDFIMDNLPADPIERNAVLDWLEESDKEGGKIDLASVGLEGGRIGKWSQQLLNPMSLIQLPQKAVVAGIEQLTNIPSGTASMKEFEQDVLDPTYGFGSFVGDVTGNKWLDRTIGFIGDVATDPMNLLLPGGSQIADVTVTGATKIAATDAAKLFAEDAAGRAVFKAGAEESLRAVGVADDVIESLYKSADELFANKAATRIALNTGDEAALAAARTTEKIAQDAFDKAASDVAKVATIAGRKGNRIIDTISKAGKILVAEDERLAAFSAKNTAKKALDVALASGDDVAIAAAQKRFDDATEVLNKATENLASKGNIKGIPVRKYGEKARLALADRVKEIRAKALLDADNTALDTATRESARAVAEVLTDQNIAKVAQQGWASIRGELADALGARGGVRFGTKRWNTRIPGSQVFADSIGDATSRARIRMQNLFGDKVLNVITPVAKSGPVDPETIIEMRTALRTGKAGNDAVNYLNIIAFNDAVVRARSLSSSKANILFNRIFKSGDSRIADSIVPYLTMNEEDWAAAGLAVPTAQQRGLINRVKDAMDTWYDEANSLHHALGNTEDLPRVENYFPLVQTETFAQWAARNPVESIKVGQVLQPTTVDPTWIATNFMERELLPGKVWFGHMLTPDDLAGGPARLNEIAKASGAFGNRNIKVFEERLIPAVASYASKHSRYIAFGRTLLDITDPMSTFLDTFRRSFVSETQGLTQRTLDEIDNLEATTAAMFTPSRIKNWQPDDIEAFINKIRGISEELDDAAVDPTARVAADRFKMLVNDAEQYAEEITRAIRSGDYPEVLIPLAKHELDNYMIEAIQEVDYLRGAVTRVPNDQWTDVVNIADTGFEVLNYRSIPNITARNEVYDLLTNVRKLNNPGVAREFSELAKAYQQWWKSWVLATPRYVRRNAFSDTFQLLLAGVDLGEAKRAFRIWQDFLNSGKSIESFALTLPPKQREAFLQVASTIPQDIKKLPSSSLARGVQKAVLGGPPSGSGGEIAGELIGGAGIFGTEATGRLPILGRYGIGPESKTAARISTTLAAPVNWARSTAGNIGDVQRFVLTWDGIAKGLNLEEAVTRTNKYLIDYASTSKFDDIVKRTVMPFWMFASRNLPMQYENMLMHPRSFNRYNYLRRFLEAKGEDREPYQSVLSTQAGAFQLDPDIVKILGNPWLENALLGAIAIGAAGRAGGFESAPSLIPMIPTLGPILSASQAAQDAGVATKFTPDFGFPGGGRPNELASLPVEALRLVGIKVPSQVRGLLGIPEGSQSTVLSQLPAPVRAFLENATNRKFYSMSDVVSAYSDLTPEQQTAVYYISQVNPWLSWLGQVPAIRSRVDISGNEALAGLLGVPLSFTSIPEGEPGSEEARIARAQEKAVAQTRGWSGSPLIPMTESEQVAEIARRRRILEAIIAEKEKG